MILSGKGWDSEDDQDDILRIGDCEGITVAHVTFADCHAYAVKVEAEWNPKDVTVYNCHFRNIGTRAIKGSGGEGCARPAPCATAISRIRRYRRLIGYTEATTSRPST